MRKFLNTIIDHIRKNGCEYIDINNSASQIVYTNLIWMVAYATFIIYTTINFFLIDANSTFIASCIFFHCCFIFCFLLIKDGYTNIGKHFLIISSYLSIAIFDHFNGQEFGTYLIFFSFLPTALNIFHFRKNLVVICLYMLIPIIYIITAQFLTYEYFQTPLFEIRHKTFFKIFVLFLTFILFVTFASYMILRNVLKQTKLVTQSLGLQITLDNAAGAIWSIDNDFNLTVSNKKYIDSISTEFGVLNLKPGDNIKKNGLWEKLPDDIKKQYYMVLSGKELLQEVKVNDKDFEIKGVPIIDRKGRILGATFGSRDVTNKNTFQKVLINAKKQAEEATRAKERFLSNMSHEIRTPLNGIIGIVDILKDEGYLDEQKDNLDNLSNLSKHTLQLVTNILDFAKIEAGKAFLDHKRFGFKQFLNKIDSIFRSTTKLKGINFDIIANGNTDIYINGDEVRLSQVLINLIGNAIKFTEKGGVQLKVDIENPTYYSHYKIKFSIIDSGIGIKKEHIQKIFEGFNQGDSETTRKFGGTGLGLSISEKILNLMQTKLIVESELGKGTTFMFDISLEKSSFVPIVSIKDDTTIYENSSLKGKKILLAEDNRINQMVAKNILTKWLSIVKVVEDGKDAYDEAKNGDYDIILMDLDMPIMDGYEATNLIRQYNEKIPIIALTAASFDDMENYLIKKGFDAVVQKPFVKDDLYKKILFLLDGGILEANKSDKINIK